jgi:AraC-like DNA-binding protein
MTQQIEDAFVETGAIPVGPGEEVVRMLDDIQRALARSPADARAAALRLVGLLNRSSGQVLVRGGLAPWQKRKIERYVKDHLPEALQVKELADQVSLSASYFHHAFKETFGTSPHAYIRTKRLESAQAMMVSTDDPLSQIASACGFSDQSHLCKIFGRALGERPGAWRRRNRSGMRTEAA